MAAFTQELEAKVAQQLAGQRVGYLLGAGASYLDGNGYPLAFQLWDKIKDSIEATERAAIQAKLDGGANGIEHALDLLDDGGATDTPYRHLVTTAVADLFLPMSPPLDTYRTFVTRLSHRADPFVRIFSLNYDPLIERAAEFSRVRLLDGFVGAEHCYFEPAVFEERIGRIRGNFRTKQFDETVKPLHLLKLHGSLGWYECPTNGVRRCAYGIANPATTRRMMIPPQRRKATDTMMMPYSALWSTFRGCLAHNQTPLNRLVCIGYGFADEHVNAVIEAALARTDFTLVILTKALADPAWNRWSVKNNVVVVTEGRCSLKGTVGVGHADLWKWERICTEV